MRAPNVHWHSTSPIASPYSRGISSSRDSLLLRPALTADLRPAPYLCPPMFSSRRTSAEAMGRRKERARRFTNEQMKIGENTDAASTGTLISEACSKLEQKPSSTGEAGARPVSVTTQQRAEATERSVYRGSVWRGPFGRRPSKELEEVVAGALKSLGN